jgi:alpha-galactosidase/6-phospho-beta-glucosidase family protein
MRYISLAVAVLLIAGICFFAFVPEGRRQWNDWFHDVRQADENSRYETRKHVEDTCRAMNASWISDRLVWLQYKDSENQEENSWAKQAKMRANKTAASYNEFMLKNSYVFSENVPEDICDTLPYIE